MDGMGQPVAFFEIVSPDTTRAQKFYADLFGWKIDTNPAMDGYALVDTQSGEGAIGGGIGQSEQPGDAGVKIYMRVDDLDGRSCKRRRPAHIAGGIRCGRADLHAVV